MQVLTLLLVGNTLDVKPAAIRVIEVSPRPSDIADGIRAGQKCRDNSRGLDQARDGEHGGCQSRAKTELDDG